MKDDAAIAEAWFEDPGRQVGRVEARDLLEQALGDARVFVLKDLRLRRLLPFWQRVLAGASIGCEVVLMLRDPLEVARSHLGQSKNYSDLRWRQVFPRVFTLTPNSLPFQCTP